MHPSEPLHHGNVSVAPRLEVPVSTATPQFSSVQTDHITPLPTPCLTTTKPHYSQPHRHIHLIHLFSIRIYHDSNKPLHSRSRPDKPLSVSHIITTSLLTCSNGGWGLPRQKFESVQVAFLSIDSFVLSVSWARRGINAPLLRTRSLHLGESPATFPNAHTACKCVLPVNFTS